MCGRKQNKIEHAPVLLLQNKKIIWSWFLFEIVDSGIALINYHATSLDH